MFIQKVGGKVERKWRGCIDAKIINSRGENMIRYQAAQPIVTLPFSNSFLFFGRILRIFEPSFILDF